MFLNAFLIKFCQFRNENAQTLSQISQDKNKYFANPHALTKITKFEKV